MQRLVSKIKSLFQEEIAGAVVLMLATVTALILANSPWSDSYHHFAHSLHIPVNDGLMAIFFFVVGLEIRQEIFDGELSSWSKSIVPIGAAIGGMVFPAIIYFLINFNNQYQAGWGIPMATDIAFALGVLSLLASRIPSGLKIFLTSLAIVDDIGAIIVIALFYSSSISWNCIIAAVVILIAMKCCSKIIETKPIVFLFLAGLLWYFVFQSGIHATVAGILAAFLLPKTLTKVFEAKLHNIVYYMIIPLFALVNAGVSLSHEAFSQASNSSLFWGIVAGLYIGKTTGIFLVVVTLVKLFKCSLPRDVTLTHIFGCGILAGIGFTMSVFIGSLAFNDEQSQAIMKVGILVASVVAAISGYVVLKMTSKRIIS